MLSRAKVIIGNYSKQQYKSYQISVDFPSALEGIYSHSDYKKLQQILLTNIHTRHFYSGSPDVITAERSALPIGGILQLL